jgi:hypothetical protein
LVNDLRRDMLQQVEMQSQLPLKAEYKFDALSGEERTDDHLYVQKTTRRTVVSLNFSKFQAKEVIREDQKRALPLRSPKLATLVPSGARYAYDLIAFVGRKTYLEGHRLKTIHEEVISQHGLPHIPFSSLYDLGRKFLFYLGEVHRQSAPQLKDYLRERGSITWLIDGTIEPGTPVFFGIKEASEGIFLDSWKIPTENEEDISNCLIEAGKHYGLPDEVLHDLSERMFNACETAFPKVPHRVCHYHLASDLGRDLYKVPQEMLSKRLRAIKLQLNLKDQRSRQTQWLQRALKEKEMPLILKDLLKGRKIDNGWSKGLGREVLLGLHGWMLDYPNDGHRQGFPFDPYLLYFHRRVVIVHDAAKRILSREAARQKLPKALFTFSSKLEGYLTDPVIIEATELYEKAFDIFEGIRSALRLHAKGPSPMHELYELSFDEHNDVSKSLDELRKQFNESVQSCSDSNELRLYEIVEVHLKKYESYLFPGKSNGALENNNVRTTNGIEFHWSGGKRIRRQTHGRTKLTRDFNALPSEYMLIPNLNNPRYVELVLGSLDQLPEKLAEAGKTAGPYSKWYNRQKPMHIGRLPTRLLRNENFIGDLIGICNN